MIYVLKKGRSSKSSGLDYLQREKDQTYLKDASIDVCLIAISFVVAAVGLSKEVCNGREEKDDEYSK